MGRAERGLSTGWPANGFAARTQLVVIIFWVFAKIRTETSKFLIWICLVARSNLRRRSSRVVSSNRVTTTGA